VKRVLIALLLLITITCQRASKTPDTTATTHPVPRLVADTTLHPLEADSIVLERGLCYGTCPAYRVAVTRSGLVHFESLTPGDSGRKATDTHGTADAFEGLAIQLLISDFLALPDSIASDERFGARCATDHPTAVVTVYIGARSKQVVDYLGCHWGPAALRELEDMIDRVSQSQRWTRPRLG